MRSPSSRLPATFTVVVLLVLGAAFTLRTGLRSGGEASADGSETERSRRSPVRVVAFEKGSGAPPNGSRGLARPRPGDTHSRDRGMLPPRSPSGELTSASLQTSASSLLAGAADPETTQTRLARWKELGLQSVMVRIVDATSHPLEGVRIRVDGVHHGQRGKSNAHGGWQEERFGPAPIDVTGPDGRALLASPVIISDLAEATGISFTASKPGYAQRRVFQYPVDGTEREEVLRRGNTLIVSAYIGTPAQRIADVVPTLSWSAPLQPEEWERLGDGRLMTTSLPDGKHALTLKHLPGEGTVWHSDTVAVEMSGGESRELQIELKASLTLRGRLSDNVPRPVRGGRVLAASQWPPPGPSVRESPGKSKREASANVAEDGTFEITALPEGPGEIIGLCDGFIASHRDPNAGHYERNQRYELKRDGDNTPIVLAMEPTGSLRVRILDAQGNPIPGATLSTWPNVFWNIGLSTVYVDGKIWSAIADAEGAATVKNLRAGSETYTVSAPGWALPAQVLENGQATRYRDAAIVSGNVTEITETLLAAPTESPSP